MYDDNPYEDMSIDETIENLKKAINTIEEIISPNIMKLSPEEMEDMIELDEEKEMFIRDLIRYARQYPESVPDSINIEEIENNFEKYEIFKKLSDSYSEINIPISEFINKLRMQKNIISRADYDNRKDNSRSGSKSAPIKPVGK
jgi:hypothetical protein